MTEWDKTKLARSYNKETREYDEAVDKLLEGMDAAKPIGKGVLFKGGRMFEVDYNFNPPRVTRLENAGPCGKDEK